MNHLRPVLALAAAILLPAALPAAPKAIRLFEVLAVRFTTDDTGDGVEEFGLLDSLGAYRVTSRTPFASASVHPDVYNRVLIPVFSWAGYQALGPEALGNFKIGTGVIPIASISYFTLDVADAPKLDLGEVINISTRATVTPGGDPAIGGFVVEGRPRRILIRGVGPGLSAYGVSAPLADPNITLYQQGSDQPLTSNDDWGQRPDADAIEQAAIATGAFPLSRMSRDAVCLIELAPGAYTVHLGTAGPSGGTALLEAYAVP